MKYTLVFCFLLLAAAAHAQTVAVRQVASLPAVLSETSGLEASNANIIWSHNDSGGQPVLYGIDTLGNLVRSITITNATNVDWEEITRDDNGNIYIGDFGNNDNNRQNLRIYKIPDPLTFSGNSVLAEVINFTYADQTAFPPADAQKNFDMEAMVFFNDSLFLFSKNRTIPFDGFTRLYKLPATPGTFTASYVDRFSTGNEPLLSQITAADISQDKKKLVLLSYGNLYCFSDFQGSQFFKGQLTKLTFNGVTQKEGICFVDNCRVYISDEEAFGVGRKLYQLDICPLTTGLNRLLPQPDIRLGTPFPNPAAGQFIIPMSVPPGSKSVRLEMYNTIGEAIRNIPVPAAASKIIVPVTGLRSQTYFCRLYTDTGVSYPQKITVLP
ncbi:hypothetical protein GXP67_07400 [Rhodocytophaga rosea]|uniref:T9SS type A sorting domain-containing protein n=1 Tax=Rhodocytophaga rosea TaxID=2704465 RepID=A0A6C0GFB2_9BACT|nr:hypothetical protein [Rhodocytophaga rosea]QHT66494.1 hypothetical protein GXP67_07400 [Rhodocytophaga rosea]